MADWQVELETLLSQLHVTLDATTALPAGGESQPGDGLGGHTAIQSNDRQDGDEAESDMPWDLGALTAEEPPADGEEVSAVRAEIQATVQQVIHLVRTGRMDSALRDDVAFVLQALARARPASDRRRGARAREREAQQEWQLTTAAAVLRFCRIVLRLTSVLTSEAEA